MKDRQSHLRARAGDAGADKEVTGEEGLELLHVNVGVLRVPR